MSPTILFMIAAMSAAQPDPRIERKDWILVVKTENGHVSILQNLSLRDADSAYKTLDDHRASGVMYHVNGSDVRQRTIIGPEGWDGCRKAFHHQFSADGYELIKKTTWRKENDPHIGMTYHWKKCVFCGLSDVNDKGEYIPTP